MQFQLTLDENDVKAAVVLWLNKQGWAVKVDDIEPITKEEREGQFEDHQVTITQVGYRVKPESLNKILHNIKEKSDGK